MTKSPERPGVKGGRRRLYERGCLLLFSLALSFFITGCRSPQPGPPQFKPQGLHPRSLEGVTITNKLDHAWLQPPTAPFTLGPGDKLEIESLGETNSVSTAVVGPDGKIYYGLLPGIDVWGLTLSEAQARLETESGKYVRERPQLSLTLRAVESKQIWVLGYVAVPGVYPLAAPMTVLEAVATAGGTLSLSSFRQQEVSGASDEIADLRHSFVLRQGKVLPVDFEKLLHQGDLSQNIYLQPDDFIYFPATTSKQVYVLGAVAQPRAVPFREGMGVAAAVASAYGTINGAYMSHVAVVRGSLAQPEIAIVDYRNVIRGTAMDVPLEPHDIVYVPFSPYRYLIRYAQLVLDTFASSAAINAGLQWIGQPGGASVFIPVGTGSPGLPAVTPPPVK